jgi:integrase
MSVWAALRTADRQRLTTARVGAFYGELVTSGGKGGRPLSPKTVRYVHTTLRRALRDAVADGLVVRNVAAQARPPRARRVEMHTWTAEQVGTFLASVREDRLYAAWLLLATLGMRRGELLGLRWADVDLNGGRIAIRLTLVMVDGKPAMAARRRSRACSFARPSVPACRQSGSMTCGIRSPRSCWPVVSTRRWSATCWATQPLP